MISHFFYCNLSFSNFVSTCNLFSTLQTKLCVQSPWWSCHHPVYTFSASSLPSGWSPSTHLEHPESSGSCSLLQLLPQPLHSSLRSQRELSSFPNFLCSFFPYASPLFFFFLLHLANSYSCRTQFRRHFLGKPSLSPQRLDKMPRPIVLITN